MLNDILAALAPYLPALLDWLIAAVVGWLALRFTRWTGIQIEARHREALQSALRNGALLALSRHLTGSPAADLVRGYVESSSPGALKYFAPSAGLLDGLIRAKLAEITR